MHLMKRALSVMLLLAAAAMPKAAAAGWSLTTLYSFCSLANCQDGASPQGGLVIDSSGNLYGATAFGGNPRQLGQGALFQIAPGGGETVVYGFCQSGQCFDGATPLASLTIDKAGNIYGTTAFGANGEGTVFEFGAGGFGSLYAFCSIPGCPDGNSPDGGLTVVDKKGVIFGTTLRGGVNKGGTVFEMADGSATALYSFCALANCADGQTPIGNLVRYRNGILFGATSAGGANGSGTVFRVTPKGKQEVLYSFCADPQCGDGSTPMAGLTAGKAGTLFGTTSKGGAHSGGTVFQVTHDGQQTVLYSFCSVASCADGGQPVAGLLLDSAGNLYGTTQTGGAHGQGTVFEVTPDGSETVLYSFCALAACADGAQPVAGLVMDPSGNLYGTTESGGTSQGKGTVFELSPE